MKILLFGCRGQTGQGLALDLPALGNVLAVDREEIDLENNAETERVILDYRPDVIVNAAAYTQVDQAENDIERAQQLNAVAPGEMARHAAALDALMVHLSTDYVFDGRASEPYREDDATNPLGVYGRSKLSGEHAVARGAPRHLILRTSWVYSLRGQNFLKTMLRLGRAGKPLRVVDDQIGCPTTADLMSRSITRLLERYTDSRDDFPFGLYHLSCREPVSWYGFAREIFRVFDLPEVRVDPIPSSEYPTPAPRPAWSVLDCSRLTRTFGIDLPDWHSALQQCRDEQRLADDN